MKKNLANKINIFISCHKPSFFLDDGIFRPIQLNSESSSYSLDGILHDNDGEDNISLLNPKYCELTAQYWAWKNINSDYYGFFHYRRYLNFSKSKAKTDEWGNVVEKKLCSRSLTKYSLDNQQKIKELISENDIIVPRKKDVAKFPGKIHTNIDLFKASKALHASDLQILMDVLSEKYPKYIPYANQYFSDHYTYLNNMYILKSEIFTPYMEWLFDILKECDKRIDYSDYSVEAIRTPGHLAERLFNIYLLKLLSDNPTLKIKELDTVFFVNTDEKAEILPAFKTNNIPIIFSANDFYAPYLSVVLESLKAKSSKHNNYDILILNKDYTEPNKNKLKDIFKNYSNFSVRFIDVSEYEEETSKFFVRGHFVMETWFRLLLPDMLSNYNKVLYLDSDIIINADVAELYNSVNLKNKLLAACRDADTAGLYNGYEPNKKDYMDNVMDVDPYNYFQAGVIVFNLEEFRKTYTCEEMLTLASQENWQLLDQDVLNVLAKNKFVFIPTEWNVVFDLSRIRIKDIISLAPKSLYDDYLNARLKPKIIHYAGPQKPWNDPNCDFAEFFWMYARNTQFYEEIVLRMTRPVIGERFEKRLIKTLFPRHSFVGKILRKTYHKIRH